jgi:DNA-binding transcriptional LysR family regulator
MDFVDLKIFKKLYITRNLTQVSKELYLSQPTLSYRLNRLRDELDAKLYHYDGKFHFTESGKRLYQFCERALKEHDGFLQGLDNRNIVRIDLSASARYRYLDRIYSIFRDSEAFPIIKFTTSDEAVSDLLDDQAMLSIVGGLKTEPDSHEFSTTELAGESIVLLYNAKLLDDITHIPILNDEIHSGLHDLVLEYLEQFESTSIAGEVGNAFEKLELINRYPVGAFVPAPFFEEVKKSYPEIRKSEHYSFERHLYLLCHHSHLSNAIVQKIIEALS